MLSTMRVRVQNFGAKMSGMIIPNLGAFIAWGILTAVGIQIDSDVMRSFIVPMLFYLLPILIAFAGGRMVYGYRGGVIAAIATMGTIIGADTVMFIGAMVMGPISALILKKFDQMIEKKIPMGFELLINNIVIGILGASLGLLGYYALAPAVMWLTDVMAAGVDVLIATHLLPLTALVIEPAKVIFLNNAIGQGVLSPLGAIQAHETGRSVLFLLESNPGPGLGILLAYMIFGKGHVKATAYGASVIHFFGGIHEIYFPFVLMKPILILPLIVGGLVGNFLFVVLDVGLVSVAAPGSIIALSAMSYPGQLFLVWLGIFAAAGVTMLVAMPFILRSKNDSAEELADAAKEMEQFKGKESRVASVFKVEQDFDFAAVKSIIYACDAGVGSSAMGKSILQKKLKEAGLEDIVVTHEAIIDLPGKCEVIVAHQTLMQRVKQKQPDALHVEIIDYLAAPEYDSLVSSIKEAREAK